MSFAQRMGVEVEDVEQALDLDSQGDLYPPSLVVWHHAVDVRIRPSARVLGVKRQARGTGRVVEHGEQGADGFLVDRDAGSEALETGVEKEPPGIAPTVVDEVIEVDGRTTYERVVSTP